MVKVINKYCGWFVLGVRCGKEYVIKEFIEKHTNRKLEMLIFSRELIFMRHNRERKVLSPLFPGYIFVHHKVREAVETVKNNFINEFINPICFRNASVKCASCFVSGSPCMVAETDMERLLCNSDVTGIIRLSYGYKNGTGIQIINGPLKQLHHQIVWTNLKKKKIGVEVELFNRKVQISLGFSLIAEPGSGNPKTFIKEVVS